MDETIDNFLIDFYKTKNNEDVSLEKISKIKNAYKGDYDLLINDLYDKYDAGGLNDQKLVNIKSAYKLNNSDVDTEPEKELVAETVVETEPEKESKEDEIFRRTGFTKGETYFRNGVELPTKPGMTGLYEINIKTGENTDRFANEEDVYSMIPVLDSLQKDAFKNPYNYGVGLEDAIAVQKLNMDSDEHRKIKENTINKFREATGLNISDRSYDYLYNALAEQNKKEVEIEYELNKIRPNQELNSVFENKIAKEFDEGKSEEELRINKYNENQYYNGVKLSEIEYKIEQTNNNYSLTDQEKQTTLTSLEKEKENIINKNKQLDVLISKEATSLKDFGMFDAFLPAVKTASPLLGSLIQSFDTSKSYKELTSKFFNDKGVSEEDSEKIAEVADGAMSVVGQKAQELMNDNPRMSQREALKSIYDQEALYLQQLESDGRNRYVELDISNAGDDLFLDAWTIIKNKGKDKYEDLGNNKIKISYESLRSLGIDSRNFEGWYDSMLNMADEKTIESIKSYNEEVNESMAIAMGYRNLWRNNVDVGAVQKPTGLVNFFQSGAVSTLGYAGLSDKEAKEVLTGDKEGFARDRINTLDQAIQIANSTPEVKEAMGGEIELTNEQKENIEVTMNEEVTSGVGSFVPDLLILGATGGTMNALGYAKLMGRLSPMMKFVTGAVVEEAKMQTILDMKPGGGAAFYTLGQATAGLTLFKKKFTWLNPLFQKVIKSGPIGAISAEGAAVSELAYESFMGDKNFKAEFDKMYGDFDDVSRRAIVNSMVFSLTGFTHVNRGDFMSTSRKYEVISKLRNAQNKLIESKVTQAVEKDGVVIPDKLKQKTIDLSSKDLKKYNEYENRIQKLEQQIQIETQYQKLNPESENFERDFNDLVTKPMNKGIKAVIPEFEGVKVRFGKGKDFRRKNFQTNEKGEDLGNTAQYNPETGEMFFDLNMYTVGKPVHEFTHAATEAYFKANPTAERNFTKRMGQIFKDFDFGEFSGTELENRIKEVYGTDLRTNKGKNLTAKEYLAFMSEIMADPKVYYTNPKLASNFMNEFRLEIKDILIESGLKTPTPKTAKDMVELMALLGKSTRMGTKLDVKIGTLAKLDEIDILGTRLIEGNRQAEAEKFGSKEIVEENSRLVKDLKAAIESQDLQLQTDIKNDLTLNNEPLINEFVKEKFKKGLGIARDEFKQGVYSHVFDKVNKTYNPSKNPEYGAYLRQVLFGGGGFGGGRLGDILKELGQKEDLFLKSTEDPTIQKELKNIEDDVPAPKEVSKKGDITVAKELNKRLNNVAEPLVSAIKEKIPTDPKLQEEFLKDKTYKSLKDLAAKETQEMFGIKPKPGNLTKSDVKNAQMFINKNPDLFYSLLPKQHTTKRVNIGTKSEPKFVTRPDKATGVQNVLLEAFYNKGTRKDNLIPWTKKPARDVSTAEFLSLFGITERGNPNLYVKNTNVSARIKALVEQTGRIITNQTVREVIPEAVEVGRGRAETMASREGVISLKLEREGTIIKSVNDRVRKYKVDPIKVDKKSSERIQEALLGDVVDVFSNFLFQGGSKFQFVKSSVMSNAGNLFERAVRKGFPAIGNYEKGLNDLVKDLQKQGVKPEAAKKQAVEIMSLTKEALDAGVIFETSKLQQSIKDKVNNLSENRFSKEELKKMNLAIDSQKLSKLEKNIKSIKEINEGKDIILDLMREVFVKNKNNMDILSFMSYHHNSNTNPFRNFATVVGKELGLKNKGYEEHTLPFGEFADTMLEAITKGDKVFNGFKKWVKDNYFQEVIDYNSTRAILDQKTRSLDKKGKELPSWQSKSQMHPLLKQHVKEALDGKRNWKDVVSSDIRKYNEYSTDANLGYINPNKLSRFGQTDAKRYNVEVSKSLENNSNIVEAQNKLIYEQLIGKITSKEAKEQLDFIIKTKGSKNANIALNKTKSEVNNSGVVVTNDKMSTSDLVNKAEVLDRALSNARKDNKTVKKARVFDFDDTVARTNSKVFATKEGERKVLTAEEFAKQGSELVEQGWDMDFSDFNRVVEGKKGPLFNLMKKMKEAAGERDMFILTARAPESAPAIKEFLDAMGIKIPLENITGLGNSTGKAKADWLVNKAAEGYNDFYFADDAPQNVKAVKDAMSVLDVKSKTQQALASKNLSLEFNKVIEESTGIGAEKVFSDVKAQVRGTKAKRQRFFIPPSAEDMLGLVYTTLGKGKKGEAHLRFYQDNLFDPYNKAMENLSTDRVNLMADFKALKKELDVPADLRKTTESGFTNEQAVRVHLWNKAGEKIPGLSKADLKELNDIVENNPKLKAFADQIMSITKGDGYSTPKDSWAVGTITTDLIDVLNTKKRSKYLENWKQNKNLIYSKENLNKLEAAYGPKYRSAVENSLRRMESGSNRLGGGNQLSNKVLDYINNSTGAIMFFNTRSAVLQTISAANFINWSFNNPLRAGKAFANQPQYWKDFVELMNSDYLKDRRNGLKLNISESEIANAAKTSGNKAKAALNYILEKGYLPTKYADSFAIASGGATFYRNRINDLIKNEGKTEAEAKEIAMLEFRKISETSQQSSDPSKISQQQSSDLGRIVLQFANTPMQYARIQKRAFQDIVNKRGDLKTNISKIAYYGFLQNMLFNGLQQAITSLGFGDDDMTEAEEKKLYKTVNGMLDSSLRGLGMAGVTVQVLKNLGIDVYDRSKRKRPEYSDSYKKLLDFSPSVKSKLGKFQSAAYPFDSKKRREEVFEKGFSLDNPAYESMAKVITGTTNLPLDRLYTKVNNLSSAMDQDNETWQSVAMVLGWPEWQIKPDKKDDKDKKEKEKTKTSFKQTKFKKTEFK